MSAVASTRACRSPGASSSTGGCSSISARRPRCWTRPRRPGSRAHLPFNTYGEGGGAITVIRGFFYIVHVGNTGAAWSMFSGSSIVLAALAAATLVGDLPRPQGPRPRAAHAQVCFGLLCGGIAGNLVDRLTAGPRGRLPRLPFRLATSTRPSTSPTRPSASASRSTSCPPCGRRSRRLAGAARALTPRWPSARGCARARS